MARLNRFRKRAPMEARRACPVPRRFPLNSLEIEVQNTTK